MTTTRTKLMITSLVSGLLVAPVGCSALLGGGYSEEGPDAGVQAPVADASPRADVAVADATAPSPDACAATPASKPGFEGNVCNGAVCAAGNNAGVLDSGFCTSNGGSITCSVPGFDAMPPLDVGVDAGGDADEDAGTADAAPPADAGPPPPTLPSCRSIPGSSPIASAPAFTYPAQVIYAIGSTAIQPYVGSIAQQYAAGVSDPGNGTAPFSATIIYVGTGSCVGVEAAYTPSSSTPKETMVQAMTAQNVAKVASGTKKVFAGTYYDPTPPAPGLFPTSYPCAIDPTDATDPSLLADVGFSDVFPSSCTTLPFAAPADPLPNAAFADLFGPVQVMEMVVPASSKVTSITYEQAQLVWGYGGAAGIAPWTDSAFLFRRTAGSGTQTMIGAAIALDPRVWKGVANSGSGNVLAELKSTIATGLPDGGAGDGTGVDKAIGILSSDFTDDNAQLLRPLAFQDRGQSCAWLPDSTPGSFDKRNVRDGHYPIWGPSHMIAPVSGGLPSNPIVNRLYAALNGQDPALARSLDVIKLYATHHIVPTCAMHVTRTTDGQDYAPYQPPGRTACNCYYDSVVPQDKPDPSCQPCTTDADCTDSSRVCLVFGGTGYCDVKGGL